MTTDPVWICLANSLLAGRGAKHERACLTARARVDRNGLPNVQISSMLASIECEYLPQP
jgi:hypothetical protein